MKPTKGQRIFAVFNYILLTLLALLCLLPMLNIVALSFSSRNMVNAGAVTFLPKEFTISSYLYMLQKSGLIPALLVTVKRLVLGVVLNLIMTISVAYPLSKSEKLFKSRKFYVAFFLITMIFNGGIIPTYLVIKQFHMLDTIWALILPNSVTMFYVLLMLIKRYVDEGYDKTGSANPDDLTAFQYAMCWGPKFGSWTRYSELRDAGMNMSVYTGAPTKTMMKRWSTLLALQDETFVKIISGSLGIEAFDDFVTQWNEQGGSTIQEEIAEMYMK